MSATEELRSLLDERGVEWESGLPTETIVREPNDALYVERSDGRMHVYFRSYLTPEQAIAATLGPCSDSCNCTDGERTELDAATLGRGTCHIEEHHGDWYCTGCGEMVGTCDTASELCIDGNAIELWSYCPNCGRRCVG